YMSVKIAMDSDSEAYRPLERGQGTKQGWISLIRDFPDRFMMGADEFFISPKSKRKFPPSAELTYKLLEFLPEEIVNKITIETPKQVFRVE
ncbi:MAG: hypothetical protein PHQ23_13485, partial [Candidatus Wallbacteria bacterium]|nr:hypothetical protein [Candidatus Wallbacteria bacterium]